MGETEDAPPRRSEDDAARVDSSRGSARGVLESCRAAGHKAIVPYLTAGYPDWPTMDRAVQALAAAGADVLELGVPFSDPLADGPTIQRSSQAALSAGVTLEQILNEVRSRRARWNLPVVLMSYLNPILAFGLDRFCEEARSAGVSGVLLSDLPPEEMPELWTTLERWGLESVVLVAPTTTAERIGILARAASAFVYCVSRTGVTGSGGPYASNLRTQVEQVRLHTKLPVVVGFGIRSPADAAQVASAADGVVIGARLIEILSTSADPNEELASFLGGVRRTLDTV